MSRSIRAAVATLLGAALAAPPVAIPQVALAEPVRDGVATPAACAPLGFQLDEPTQVDDLVLTGSRVSAHAPRLPRLPRLHRLHRLRFLRRLLPFPGLRSRPRRQRLRPLRS
ncbi:hypothetical protein [Brevundimonas sp. Marseille-Q4549]